MNLWGPVAEIFIGCQQIFNVAAEENVKIMVTKLEHFNEQSFLALNYDICIAETSSKIKEDLRDHPLSGEISVIKRRPDKMEFNIKPLEPDVFQQLKHALGGYFCDNSNIKVFNDILWEFFA